MHVKTAFRALGIAVLMGVASAQAETPSRENCFVGCPADGREYRKALIQAIAQADRIVVTEHSSPWDVPGEKDESALMQQDIEYARVSLSAEQKARFGEIIASMHPGTQNWASACIPAFHHTVRFYLADTLKTTMKICFVCSQVEWDGVGRIAPPGAIYASLKEFISSIGLSPKREWRALATEQLAAQ